MSKKESTFEKDLESLEKIVEALEEGGLPLDESLKRFEDGIKLVRRCEGALSSAEKKIEMLTTNAAGKAEVEPFDPENAEAPAPAKAGRADSGEIPEEPEEDDDDELLF